MVGDSTVGATWPGVTGIGIEDATWTQGALRTRCLFEIGGTMQMMYHRLREILRNWPRVARVWVVPMARALDPANQVHYDCCVAHQRRMLDTVSTMTPHVQLTEPIMSLAPEYAQVCWGAPYWDSCSQMYRKSQNKLHLRPGPWAFFMARFVSVLGPGDMLLVLGWNNWQRPETEFEIQANFIKDMMRL